MIYFASDIHLGAGDPATARCTERRFTAWLDAVSRESCRRGSSARWANWPN